MYQDDDCPDVPGSDTNRGCPVVLVLSAGPVETVRADGTCSIRVEVTNDGAHPATGFTVEADIEWTEGGTIYNPTLELGGPDEIDPGQTRTYDTSVGNLANQTPELSVRGSVIADGVTHDTFSRGWGAC